MDFMLIASDGRYVVYFLVCQYITLVNTVFLESFELFSATLWNICMH